jgi:hypothetical protein
LPTPATSEPGFTVSPVDKDGNPTNNPNERWYHPETGRLLQKGISQVLKENDLLRTPVAGEVEGGAVSPAVAKAKGQTLRLSGQMIDMVAPNQLPKLMPTPNTMDHLPARTAEQKEKNKGKGGYANVRETVVNDLIPTPTTRDHKDGSQPHERDGIIQTDTVARAVFNSGEVSLPTPTASDWKGANHSGSGSASSRGIATVSQQLLPTLRASDGYERRNQKTMDRIAAEGGDMTMPTLARTQTDWGKFEPAIRRWEETLGRPAPAPTKPDGKDGAHRLSSAFTEWMMGVPEGWITD